MSNRSLKGCWRSNYLRFAFILIVSGFIGIGCSSDDSNGRSYKVGERFTDTGDGTVRDNASGLIWLKNASALGRMDWQDARAEVAALSSGDYGLTDGSTAGDWRLPTKHELQRIGTNPPKTWESPYPPVSWRTPYAPFIEVQPHRYWSSTEDEDDSYYMWYVNMYNGLTSASGWDHIHDVWPVR